MAPIHLCFELLLLLAEGFETVFQVRSAMPILFQPDDARQIGIRQALQLLGEAGLPAIQSVTPGLQFLWKPVSAMGSFQRLSDGIGVRQQFTQIGPDQVFEALGRAQARRTLLFAMREQRRHLARAGVIAKLVDRGPSQAR